MVGYALPLSTLPFANRIEDYRLHAETLKLARRVVPNVPSRETPNDDLALILIDEESIGNAHAGLGNWPFKRGVYGKLLQRLRAAGAAGVAFDIDFLEPSSDPSQDRTFAAAARGIPTVVGYTVTTTSSGIPGAEVPPPELRSSMRIGFTTIDTPGGIVLGQPLRLAPMPQGFPGAAATSLALAAADLHAGTRIDPNNIPSLKGETLIVPFSTLGRMDISKRAGAQTLDVPFIGQSLSFSDALTASPDQLRLFARNRTVIVGATAQALSDFAPTLDGLVPGVYLHARLIDQLLTSTFITPAPAWLDELLILVLPLLLAAALAQLRAPVAVTLAVCALLGYALAASALFAYHLYWLDVLHTGGAMLLAGCAVIGYRVLTEAAQRRFVTEIFGAHVSPAVVKQLTSTDDPAAALALSGKRAKVTIFYSDIRGFTALSEPMTAEAIYGQLNEYFDAMCEVIFKYGGYVDKFIGDCIMVVFSAPEQTPDDAIKAVDAALEQQHAIGKLAQRWEREGKKPFSVGMGINTGWVVMGNLGSSSRMNYTVIGDDVNVASRLYNVAAGGQIIVSESTWREVQNLFEVRELEPVTVKGKSAPLRNFEVLGRRENLNAEKRSA